MTFADRPAGASILLDSNSLVYHFAIVTIMQVHGLSNLASNDTDFDRVPGITRYAPI